MRRRRQNKCLLSPVGVITPKRRVESIEQSSIPSGMSRLIKLKGDAHICVIRSCGGLGDVLMITPALRELKRIYPSIILTVAVDRHSTHDDHYYGILKNAPFIDELIDARYVERRKYDKVIDISAVCIPYERKQLPAISRINLFATYLGVASPINTVPFYQVELHEVVWAKNLTLNYRNKGPLIALNTASNDPKRNLPAINQEIFIRWILNSVPNATIILFDFNHVLSGSTVLQEFDSSIYNASSTTVREMAALIDQCNVFVGPDSGPMHLAAALQVPSVVPFGSIPPNARIGHYPTHTAVRDEGLSCLGCWYDPCPIDFACMKNIKGGIVGNIILKKLREPKHNIVFQSVLNPCDGYGSAAEQIALGLDKLVPDLRFTAFDPNQIPSNWEELAQPRTPYLVDKHNLGSVYLGCYAPNSLDKIYNDSLLMRRSSRRYLYSLFESTKVPSSWIDNVNIFDKLFVACEENKKAFASCGVTIPIVTIPLGVSPDLWPYKKRDKSGRPFRFLLFANSDWKQQRKNYSAAFDAFVAAFGNRTDVELIMKVTAGTLPHHVSSQSNVKIIHSQYTQPQLLDLLHNVDCLLFPSKGEGFGLPPREAMATGIPVVAASWGGLESIMKLDFNYSVPFTMVKATYAGSIDEWLVSQNRGSRDFGLWCDVSVTKMANILRSIPDDYGDVLSRGKSCAEWIRNNETYDICTQRLLDEIS